MSRTHCRIADLEFEDPGCGIEWLQIGKPVRFCPRLAGELNGLRSKAVDAFGYQRSDSALDDQRYQLLGRVVASRAFAGARVLGHLNPPASCVEPVFENALVGRPELLNREIAIIDVFGWTAIT